MTKKEAFKNAIFVGTAVTAFQSFVMWDLFNHFSPTGNDNQILETVLPITPFIGAIAFGFVAFNIAQQVFERRIKDQSESSTENE